MFSVVERNSNTSVKMEDLSVVTREDACNFLEKIAGNKIAEVEKDLQTKREGKLNLLDIAQVANALGCKSFLRPKGMTPLHVARACGHLAIMELFFSRKEGSAMDSWRDELGRTPIFYLGHENLFDCQKKTHSGTAVCECEKEAERIEELQAEGTKFLLKNGGADILFVQDKTGQTPFDSFVIGRQLKSMQVAVDYLYQKTFNVLHAALLMFPTEVVKIVDEYASDGSVEKLVNHRFEFIEYSDHIAFPRGAGSPLGCAFLTMHNLTREFNEFWRGFDSDSSQRAFKRQKKLVEFLLDRGANPLAPIGGLGEKEISTIYTKFGWMHRESLLKYSINPLRSLMDELEPAFSKAARMWSKEQA